MPLNLKCKKCRKPLTSNNLEIYTGHNELVNLDKIKCSAEVNCEDATLSAFYIQEENFPEWVAETVANMGWVSGKLKCPSCSVTLGSADFVAGRKCSCGDHLLPPVKILRSKVDSTWTS